MAKLTINALINTVMVQDPNPVTGKVVIEATPGTPAFKEVDFDQLQRMMPKLVALEVAREIDFYVTEGDEDPRGAECEMFGLPDIQYWEEGSGAITHGAGPTTDHILHGWGFLGGQEQAQARIGDPVNNDDALLLQAIQPGPTGAEFTVDIVDGGAVATSFEGAATIAPVNAPNLLGNVQCMSLVGNAAASVIEVLAVPGDTYVVSVADGVAALAAAAVGDVWQEVGGVWTLIAAGVGGFPPAGFYGLLSTTTAVIAPYTPVVDAGKRVAFDGASLTGTLNTPVAGDSYVIDGAGTTNEGDIREWSGAAWVQLEAAAGGFVAAGVRAILALSPTVPLIAPYVDGTDDGKVVDFTGASNTGVDTGDAVDEAAVLAQDSGAAGFFYNVRFVFDGTVPTGSWDATPGSALTIITNVAANDYETLAGEINAAAGAGAYATTGMGVQARYIGTPGVAGLVVPESTQLEGGTGPGLGIEVCGVRGDITLVSDRGSQVRFDINLTAGGPAAATDAGQVSLHAGKQRAQINIPIA